VSMWRAMPLQFLAEQTALPLEVLVIMLPHR
jgi:hypothetical protein